VSLTVSSNIPGIRATIVLDSIGPNGARLTTIEAEAPRIILAEINTHRLLSRGSASSRAVPGPRMLARVRDEPAIPAYWGKNQPGMQAETELVGEELEEAQRIWDELRLKALEGVEKLHSLGLHKQLANRPLETWMRHVVVITATEWSNLDGLRRHKAAQPEFHELAKCIHEVLLLSKPQALKCGEAHLPYVTGYDEEDVEQSGVRLGIDNIKEMVSIARVCRVSYLNHDGDRDIDKDVPRYRTLVESGHMSPTEHVAYALSKEKWETMAMAAAKAWIHERTPVGNFWGWQQYRKGLLSEHDFSKMRAHSGA
jgi:thymidylate synthase ThyX